MALPALIWTGGALYLAARFLRRYLDPGSSESPALPSPPDAAAPAPEPEPSEAEREADRELRLAGGGLALALVGASLPSAVLTLYSARPMFRQAYRDFKERRIRAAALDSIAVVSGLLLGFDVASALCAVLYSAGCKLVARTEDHSRRRLVNIFGEQERFVWLVQGGVEVEVPLDQLRAGDLIAVSAGHVIPVDGIVREGAASVDQHKLTGEAQSVDKGVGDRVLAATFVEEGHIRVEVEKAGASTVAGEVAAILDQTADYRGEVQARAQRLGDRAVLPLLGLAAAALLLVGGEAATVVLSSNFNSCLRVAAPLAMLHFLGEALRRGILIKDGRALELVNEVDTVVFDKTGTLTTAEPHVGAIHTFNGVSAGALLSFAAAAEARQTHPVARAIVKAAKERSLPVATAGHRRYQLGHGIKADIEGSAVLVGSARFMALSGVAAPPALEALQAAAEERGYSLVYVAVNGELGGVLELCPTLRPEVFEVTAALRRRGLSLCIVSGDHLAPTRHLAGELGIDRYFAEVLPQEKAALVRALRAEGRRVCMVGDGINDAIAMKTANASVSLRGATMAATDTAQVVLMDGDLSQLPQLFELAGELDANVRVTVLTTVVPAALSIAGAFLWHVGIYENLLLFNLSFFASVTNAMLPALRHAAPPVTDRSQAPAFEQTAPAP